MQLPKLHTKLLVVLAWISLLPNVAMAEFRAVSAPKAILYDTPSAQGKKLFILSQGYPVEVIVTLAEWVKVRDNQGGLSWIEAKKLTAKRTVLVTAANAEVRQTPENSGVVVGHVEKDVVLDLLEPAKNGWIKIKHRDGITGFVPSNVVWGL
jgi:SH3-like domain-containing protein